MHETHANSYAMLDVQVWGVGLGAGTPQAMYQLEAHSANVSCW